MLLQTQIQLIASPFHFCSVSNPTYMIINWSFHEQKHTMLSCFEWKVEVFMLTALMQVQLNAGGSRTKVNHLHFTSVLQSLVILAHNQPSIAIGTITIASIPMKVNLCSYLRTDQLQSQHITITLRLFNNFFYDGRLTIIVQLSSYSKTHLGGQQF